MSDVKQPLTHYLSLNPPRHSSSTFLLPLYLSLSLSLTFFHFLMAQFVSKKVEDILVN